MLANSLILITKGKLGGLPLGLHLALCPGLKSMENYNDLILAGLLMAQILHE